MVKGSKPHIPYTLVDGQCNKNAVLCEGEFDAMLLHQEAGDVVDVYTLGSASKRINEQNRTALLLYRKIWLAYDNDEAGQQRIQKLQETSNRMNAIQLPMGCDIGDIYSQDYKLRSIILQMGH